MAFPCFPTSLSSFSPCPTALSRLQTSSHRQWEGVWQRQALADTIFVQKPEDGVEKEELWMLEERFGTKAREGFDGEERRGRLEFLRRKRRRGRGRGEGRRDMEMTMKDEENTVKREVHSKRGRVMLLPGKVFI